MSSIILFLASFVAITLAQSSSSSGNIYGYNIDSNALANGPFLVQNPNYQFLNNQLASEYAKTYQEEQQLADAQYYGTSGSSTGSLSTGYSSDSTSGSSSSSYNGQIPVSTSYVPANGYYYGSVLTNAQQNAINYQQITQANPSSSSSASSSTNIYGYNTGSGSSSGSASTYNNQQMYSAPSSSSSTATPYIYPFGQFASSSSTSSSNNQVYRDTSSNSATSGSSTTNSSEIGRTYSLFYNDQTATPAYQSQSDLKTTTLRDQALPSNVNLRGAGPMPGPTLGSSSTVTQQFNDVGSNSYYYGNANMNTGSARVKFSSYPSTSSSPTRFFDVAGNQTEMYYPYRTSTNYNLPSSSVSSGSSSSSTGTSSGTSSGSTTFYDSLTPAVTTADKCRLSDPYWCADYVNVFTSSKRNYTSESTQTICSELISSLTESYNGCCTAVRSAGCSM